MVWPSDKVIVLRKILLVMRIDIGVVPVHICGYDVKEVGML
jgi:hypothetical protein